MSSIEKECHPRCVRPVRPTSRCSGRLRAAAADLGVSRISTSAGSFKL